MTFTWERTLNRKHLNGADFSSRTSRPAEFLHPWFQNQTCVPFTEESQTCELGNYASYSINVSCVADIRAGLSFAQDNNIRLVIKNSGHE